MDCAVAVRNAAKRLNMLDASGGLVEMDSIAIIDLVVELERACKVTIPIAQLRQESFASLETVTALIRSLTGV